VATRFSRMNIQMPGRHFLGDLNNVRIRGGAPRRNRKIHSVAGKND
jgi:hypothetical protein